MLLLYSSFTQWGCEFLAAQRLADSPPAPAMKSMPNVKWTGSKTTTETNESHAGTKRKAQIEHGSIFY